MATAKATGKKRGRPAKTQTAAAPATTVKKRGRPAKAATAAAKPVKTVKPVKAVKAAKPVKTGKPGRPAKAVKPVKAGKPGRPAKTAKPVSKMEKAPAVMDATTKLKETLAAKSEADLNKVVAKFTAAWQKKRSAADGKKIKAAEKKAAAKAKAAKKRAK